MMLEKSQKNVTRVTNVRETLRIWQLLGTWNCCNHDMKYELQDYFQNIGDLAYGPTTFTTNEIF